jgi:hypothetical protein
MPHGVRSVFGSLHPRFDHIFTNGHGYILTAEREMWSLHAKEDFSESSFRAMMEVLDNGCEDISCAIIQ